MGKKTPTDSVYRAAILTARDLDATSEPTRTSAGVALAATLERHGVTTLSGDSKSSGKTNPGILELDNAEGIVVSVGVDERAGDWTTVARQNHWRKAHLVHFAPRALSIKTVAM